MDDNESAFDNEEAPRDVFQTRLGAAPSPPPGVYDSELPEIYQAYSHAQEGREEEGLTLYHEDGSITVKFYVHLTEIICTTPKYLTLLYMDCMVTLHGRNLHKLIPLLKRRKVDALHCYQNSANIEPANEPVIYHIVRDSHAEAEAKGRAEA